MSSAETPKLGSDLNFSHNFLFKVLFSFLETYRTIYTTYMVIWWEEHTTLVYNFLLINFFLLVEAWYELEFFW